MKKIKIKDFIISNESPMVLISGPCVYESDDLVFEVLEKMLEITERYNINYIFKTSYLKDNRTAAGSFRGPGIDAGIALFNRIKERYDVPILTDIHHPDEAFRLIGLVDIIQIPAFLSRQTSLLESAGHSGIPVNIKKGQFLAPEDMQFSAGKVSLQGNDNIMLTERGSSFGYGNLVVDMRSFSIMKETGYPVIYDVTHSLQRPSQSGKSGGNPEFAPAMAKSAAAQKIAGFFVETHPDPDTAFSDSGNMYTLDKMDDFLKELKELDDFVKF